MAEATVPAPRSASWLDRPFLPTWQRAMALTANWEAYAYAGIVLASFVLRIWDVGGRAMHHDESLHAYYSWKLYSGQGYSYSPLMHGPLQFEVVPLFYLLFGVSDFSARLLAVVLGTVLVFLPYFLRSYLTRPGALLAAAMLAISPAFVYFSRFIRDDIYLVCFTLILFIALVRYLEEPRARYLYIAAAAMALAMASMEAAYINYFILGTFLIWEAVREFAVQRDGPVLRALRATSLDTWLTSFSIFVVLTVLFYSTFFTNPYGIWDTQHSLLSPARQDILGGLTYWHAQQGVDRGGQPWFYYLLIMPLYEQLALLFGAAGLVYSMIRRTFFRTFLVWWAIGSFALYSWAGEKMPWLAIHIALPLILLAGLFLGEVIRSRRTWPLLLAGSGFVLFLALEIHSTFVLNFVDGANPTEMLVYVQTSQDVKTVVNETTKLSQRLTGGTSMPIGLDDADVGGWPFIWYLRNFTGITETSSFSGPVCGGTYCPVLIMLEPEFDQYSSQLVKRYVVQKYRWNWWFPEDYKVWFPQHWSALTLALQGKGSLAAALPTGNDWSNIWQWLIYRRPFGYRGARWLYFLVERNLVPGSKYFPTHLPGVPAPVESAPSLPAQLRAVLGSTGTAAGSLDGPRGIAADRRGHLYVADTLNHRIVEFSNGNAVRSWGQAGTGRGQFSVTQSPQSLAVGPDGNVYVADTWNQRIQVFNPTGRFLRAWGGGQIASGPGQFYGPRSIAVSSDGRVYVADTGNRRIQVFSTSGHYQFSFGAAGRAHGQFEEPSAVALGPQGNVYVADFWNQRIQEFTHAGVYLRSWPVLDWTPQSYDEPYLAVDQRTGDVYATDPQQQRVLVFSATGRPLGSFGSSQLGIPIGVTVRADGTVAVSDATANHVDIFAIEARPSYQQKLRVQSATRAKKP